MTAATTAAKAANKVTTEAIVTTAAEVAAKAVAI